MGLAASTEPLSEEQLVLIRAEAGRKRRQRRRRQGKRPGSYVRREDKVRDILEALTRREWPSVRPGWLVNPYTGAKMEIDCFCDALKCCVEVDGAQHYGRVAFMHKKEGDYRRQVARDHLKDRICAQLGYRMIRVPPRSQLDDSQLAWYLCDRLGRLPPLD